jgi:nucleotide-binding universal stress UspA family protein
MFQRIMLPLDGSPLAEVAAPIAARLAKRDGARLHLVTVHHLAPNPETAGWAEADNAMRDAEREYLDRFARDMLDCYSIQPSTALLEGLPARTVLRDFVAEAKVDLVVMTTHGRTGLRRAWLGSVADGVVQDSHVPVLLVRPWKRTGVRWDRGFRNVIVPLDGSAPAAQVLPSAFALAVADGPTFTLVQVVEPVTRPIHPYSYAATPVETDVEATERLAADAKASLAVITTRLRREEPGVDVSALVLVDSQPGQAVLELVAGKEASLIAMTTSGRGLARTLRGGFADKVLREATCPVMVYRPRGD